MQITEILTDFLQNGAFILVFFSDWAYQLILIEFPLKHLTLEPCWFSCSKEKGTKTMDLIKA